MQAQLNGSEVAQGIGVGLMLGRFGLQAIAVCRPVPFTGEEPHQPRFKRLYIAMKDLLGQAVGKPASA